MRRVCAAGQTAYRLDAQPETLPLGIASQEQDRLTAEVRRERTAAREARAKRLAEYYSRRHCLTNLDLEAGLAECSQCGPVSVKVRDRKRGRPETRCGNMVAAEWRKRKYGIGLDAYEELVALQGGRCRICGAAGRLVVDHDHETGDVRGLLCGTCNSGIGMLRDDPDLIRAALAYLLAG